MVIFFVFLYHKACNKKAILKMDDLSPLSGIRLFKRQSG